MEEAPGRHGWIDQGSGNAPLSDSRNFSPCKLLSGIDGGWALGWLRDDLTAYAKNNPAMKEVIQQ
jgi:hypothetical protein